MKPILVSVTVLAALLIGWWFVRNGPERNPGREATDPSTVATANAAIIAGGVPATLSASDAGPGGTVEVGERSGGPASATTEPDGGGAPTSPARPSAGSDPRTRFLREANSICARSESQLQDRIQGILAKDATGAAAIEEQRRQVYTLVVTDVRRHIDELEDLTPTAGLEGQFGDYIREMRAGLRTIEGQGPDRFFEQQSDPFAKALGQVRNMGLKQCG